MEGERMGLNLINLFKKRLKNGWIISKLLIQAHKIKIISNAQFACRNLLMNRMLLG